MGYGIEDIEDMLGKYRRIMVELVMDWGRGLDIIKVREERLMVKYIVRNNCDLEKVRGGKENIVLCGILLDEKNIRVEGEMVIRKEEVVKMNENVKECYLKD